MCYLKPCWEPHASHPVHFRRCWVGSPKGRCFPTAGRGEWLSEGCGLKLNGAQAQLRTLLDLTLGKRLYSVPRFRKGDVECPLFYRAVVKIQWDNTHKGINIDPGTPPHLQNGSSYWHPEDDWRSLLAQSIRHRGNKRGCSQTLQLPSPSKFMVGGNVLVSLAFRNNDGSLLPQTHVWYIYIAQVKSKFLL